MLRSWFKDVIQLLFDTIMPILFEELVINGNWDFYNFIEWNLAVWIALYFGPITNQRLYPPNFKEYVITCIVFSCFITCFYVFYLIWVYLCSLLQNIGLF